MVTPVAAGAAAFPAQIEGKPFFQLQEIGIQEFVEQFEKKDSDIIDTDEFEFTTGSDDGRVSSITSRKVGDCITMFGIGADGSIFGWHCSTLDKSLNIVEKSTEKELKEQIKSSLYMGKSQMKIPYDIFLVGGNGSSLSLTLAEAMRRVIPRVFAQSTIQQEFLHKVKGDWVLSANLDTNRALHYCFFEDNEG